MHPRLGTALRARGRPDSTTRDRCARGNSPAGAGTTWRRSCGTRPEREQPRGRGDDTLVGHTALMPEGTAPRARGRQGHGPPAAAGHGNSPAGAGTTPARCRSPRGRWEQPRGRGDDLPAAHHQHPGRGNNPAGAGTTTGGTRATTGAREQPRGRGDDSPSTFAAVSDGGTAPRARGRRGRGSRRRQEGGNSPAGAGTTPARR